MINQCRLLNYGFKKSVIVEPVTSIEVHSLTKLHSIFTAVILNHTLNIEYTHTTNLTEVDEGGTDFIDVDSNENVTINGKACDDKFLIETIANIAKQLYRNREMYSIPVFIDSDIDLKTLYPETVDELSESNVMDYFYNPDGYTERYFSLKELALIENELLSLKLQHKTLYAFDSLEWKFLGDSNNDAVELHFCINAVRERLNEMRFTETVHAKEIHNNIVAISRSF